MSKLRFLPLIVMTFLFLACEKDEDRTPYAQPADSPLDDAANGGSKYYQNPPYPVNADTLRVLAIGNSFTTDAMTYLDTIVKVAGINADRLCLYKAHKGGASFDTWIEAFHNESAVSLERITGGVTMTSQGTLSQLLNQPWDVIVVQQASNLSYVWSSYASLKEYIALITTSCPNKSVCLAFQLVWSHTPDEMPHVLQGNVACCQQMSQEYGIDVIIPTGTAIQLARGTRLNDDSYMTRDNWHLNTGMACYIASCTWFESLLRPVFGIPIVGNTAKPQNDYPEADILLGQQCAELAVLHPYIITEGLSDLQQ